MQQRRSLDGFGMEKRSHGFTRPSEDEADGEAPSLFGKTGSPNTSPTSSPIRRTAEAAASAVPSGLAVVKPIVAAIIIYMTVLVHVIHLWGERTSNFDDAMPVLPAQEVAASAKSIKTPLASEARSTAPDSVPVIQSGRKLELLGKLLRASWLWAKAGDPGVIGDQRQHQPVSGLSAEELRFRAVELQQPDVFQLIMRDGSRVQAKDCHLLSRSVADMQQLQLPALSAGGANTALSGETLALRCPQDIDVRWSVGLLQLPTGAEVLRQTMRFDRSSPKNRGQAHGVSRLVLWSLRTPGCAAFADSSAREAPLHKAQAAACFAPAPVLAFRGKQLVNSSSQDIVDGSPLVSVSAGAWLSLEHPRSTYVRGADYLQVGLENPLPGTVYAASLGVAGQASLSASVGNAGVVEDVEDALFLLRRHFLAYLDVIRPTQPRTHLHYTTWYDLRHTPCMDSSPLGVSSCSAAHPLSGQLLTTRLQTVHSQLTELRGVQLDGMLVDDGWDASSADPWQADAARFTAGGLASLQQTAGTRGASVGLWMSPWGGYREAGKRRIRALTEKLYGSSAANSSSLRALDLGDPSYYKWFRNATRDLVWKAGVRAFKFDGFSDGLGAKGASGTKAAAADAILSLAAALREEASAATAAAVAAASKENAVATPVPAQLPLWVTASTGAWPSPYWLLAADAIWRDGPDLGREGVGSPRQQWITFRDSMVYERVVRRSPLFPLASLSTGGVVWSRAEESGAYLNSFDIDDFRIDVRSFFLSGASLQELQVQPELLAPIHWDIIADAANVSKHHAAVLRDAHWIGGDPAAGEVYGYGSFACPPCSGFVSLRNPGARHRNITFTLRRALALPREWQGGAEDGVWRIQRLWKPVPALRLLQATAAPANGTGAAATSNVTITTTAAPDGIARDKVALDEELTVSLTSLEFQAYQILRVKTIV
eukprot:TRINITY_DN254_c0_g3_i1.p1 TRINITY_DN254_c0_g3~~TRINITY_DN254_c0_g3_i1.p1  ORF type:complete len:940 (+),score=152.14 TRINITY_DN254_c0_g3_i1:84-2903(+)